TERRKDRDEDRNENEPELGSHGDQPTSDKLHLPRSRQVKQLGWGLPFLSHTAEVSRIGGGPAVALVVLLNSLDGLPQEESNHSNRQERCKLEQDRHGRSLRSYLLYAASSSAGSFRRTSCSSG